VLSGPALEKLNNSVLEEVIITNTIPENDKKDKCSKLTYLSVAPLLGEAIRRIHEESSVSSLFI
jgi:ribose-phosphate pyrophosphokinase